MRIICLGWGGRFRYLCLNPLLFLISLVSFLDVNTRRSRSGGSRFSYNIYKYIIYIYFISLYLLNNPLLPPLRGRHTSCPEMSYSKRERKLKKEKKNKIFPFMPFKLKSWPDGLTPLKGSYSCDNPQLWHLVKVRVSSPGLWPIHSPSQTSTIHSYPGPYSSLA